MTNALTCTFPVNDPDQPERLCGRPVIAIYNWAGTKLPRCKRHDTDKVRQTAQEMGATRQPINP